MERSISGIQKKIENHDAVVMTAQEICERVEKEDITIRDVDVVTTATRAIMSGTYAVLSFPAKAPFHFTRASKVLINGVPAHVGPCPNESLGVLDLMVFGTAHSSIRCGYGAGHLFREMVEQKTIDLSVTTNEDNTFQSEITLAEMPYAKLHSTRNVFKNYSAFVNCSNAPVNTIFHATPFEPDMESATFSGCGQINPVKNDPQLQTIGMGTRVIINGGEGFVIGCGTRSSPEKPNLTGVADMHNMDPQLMGGFLTSAGPECIVSWAVPIPVLNQSILDAIIIPDREIPMPVMDVDKRVAVSASNYADAWENVDLSVKFDPSSCLRCKVCKPIENCPMDAIHKNEKPVLDRDVCFNCGLCTTNCPGNVFTAELGAVRVEKEGKVREVPIVLRQSDRKRALSMAEKLKKDLIDGSFKLTGTAGRIQP